MTRNMQQAGYVLDRYYPDLLAVPNAHYDPEITKDIEMVYANPEKPGGATHITAYFNLYDKRYYYWRYAEFIDILCFKIIQHQH